MLSLFVLICFPFLIWSAWKNVRLSRESAGWPMVPGTITLSEMARSAWRRQPRVTYSYEVDGKTYNGTKVNFAPGVPAREAQAILGRYEVGRTANVSYSPKNPSLAVLEPGPNRFVNGVLRSYIVVFLLIAALNAAYIWVSVKYPSSESSTPPRTYDDVAAADPGLGDRLIQEGADKGDAKDEGYVGVWYLGGLEGYTKDPAKAAEWLLKSAQQGEPGSESLLAELYVKGEGVPRDNAQAVSWFQKAADQGDPNGCVGIGMAYEQGVAGYPKDTQKAIEWYRKAGNNPNAQKALARLGAN